VKGLVSATARVGTPGGRNVFNVSMTEVRDNPEKNRYELLEDGKLLGVADYRPMGDQLAFPHTEIVPARRNQGLGAQLVQGALDDVRRKGAKVVPYCWFVAEFIEANPEYADLRA
jgi:predicted GNAT family acetyltransferase